MMANIGCYIYNNGTFWVVRHFEKDNIRKHAKTSYCSNKQRRTILVEHIIMASFGSHYCKHLVLATKGNGKDMNIVCERECHTW